MFRDCLAYAQVDVEKYVCLLTGSLQSTPEFEGKDLSEVFYMIDELEQLSAALDARLVKKNCFFLFVLVKFPFGLGLAYRAYFV